MVKFISFDGRSTVFYPETENIGLLAVHPVNKMFAVAESDVLDPKISIFEYPTMTVINVITGKLNKVWYDDDSVIKVNLDFYKIFIVAGGAEIDFTSVVFSYSDFLCTTSGVPDFTMILWWVYWKLM